MNTTYPEVPDWIRASRRNTVSVPVPVVTRRRVRHLNKKRIVFAVLTLMAIVVLVAVVRSVDFKSFSHGNWNKERILGPIPAYCQLHHPSNQGFCFIKNRQGGGYQMDR